MARRFVGTRIVAETLGQSQANVRRLILAGEIPAARIGPRGDWLIPARVLDDLIENDDGPEATGPTVRTPAVQGDGDDRV